MRREMAGSDAAIEDEARNGERCGVMKMHRRKTIQVMLFLFRGTAAEVLLPGGGEGGRRPDEGAARRSEPRRSNQPSPRCASRNVVGSPITMHEVAACLETTQPVQMFEPNGYRTLPTAVVIPAVLTSDERRASDE